MSVSGETPGLAAALAYAHQMAASAGQGAASVETSLASLQAGDVSGPALGHLANAQEALTSAQGAFQAAHTELQRHIAVKDAYGANPDAGTKQFVTND